MLLTVSHSKGFCLSKTVSMEYDICLKFFATTDLKKDEKKTY